MLPGLHRLHGLHKHFYNFDLNEQLLINFMLLLFNESFTVLTFTNGLYSIIIMLGVHHCTGIKKHSQG